MKIIGIGGSAHSPEEYICTISRNEIARLCGQEYSLVSVRNGDTINVSHLAKRVDAAIKLQESAANAAEALRACATIAETAIVQVEREGERR